VPFGAASGAARWTNSSRRFVAISDEELAEICATNQLEEVTE